MAAGALSAHVHPTQIGRLDLLLGGPESVNPLDGPLLADLERSLRSAWSDAAVRVIVIRSQSARAFSVGADLRELAALEPDAARETLRYGQQVMSIVESSPKPILSVVDGFALGGGFELCLATSFTVASERARFGLPEARLGLIPGYGGTQRLTRLVGSARALRVMLTGAMFSAREMFELGALAVPPVSPDDLDDAVAALVDDMLKGSPAALASVLLAVRAAQHGPLATGLATELELAVEARLDGDGAEGIAAFLEKREPRFPPLSQAAVERARG